jgi:putative chitinase
MTVTPAQLRALGPHLSAAHAEEYAGPLNEALAEFGIDNAARVAAFLAQVFHESGELKYWEEIWGPTDAQRRYEGRVDLGNIQPGDGHRYKGRGPIQITGRGNYHRYGRLLGIDLEGHPDLAALPAVGFRVAAAFWKTHGLNELADKGQFRAITKRINGGLNGLASRLRYWEQAKQIFREGPALSVPIHVAGTLIPERGWLDPDNHAWVPLRPVYVAMPPAWQSERRIGPIERAGDHLEIELIQGAVSRRVPVILRAGAGYVMALTLLKWGVSVDWRSGSVYLEAAS